jgi:hypothetical protein
MPVELLKNTLRHKVQTRRPIPSTRDKSHLHLGGETGGKPTHTRGSDMTDDENEVLRAINLFRINNPGVFVTHTHCMRIMQELGWRKMP